MRGSGFSTPSTWESRITSKAGVKPSRRTGAVACRCCSRPREASPAPRSLFQARSHPLQQRPPRGSAGRGQAFTSARPRPWPGRGDPAWLSTEVEVVPARARVVQEAWATAAGPALLADARAGILQPRAQPGPDRPLPATDAGPRRGEGLATTGTGLWETCWRGATEPGQAPGAGLRLAAVSNSNGTLRRLFDRLGFQRPPIEVILDSRSRGGEARPPIFHLALERLGAEAGAAGHVGDFYHVDVVGGSGRPGSGRCWWTRPGSTRTPTAPGCVAGRAAAHLVPEAGGRISATLPAER